MISYSLPFFFFLKFMFIVLLLISCPCFVIGIPIFFGDAMKNSCGWVFRLFSVKSWPISLAYALEDVCADYLLIFSGRFDKCWCKIDHSKDYCSNERREEEIKRLLLLWFRKLIQLMINWAQNSQILT